ncbi:MAG: hypothetical protein KIT83_20375, partial [Bryobacterales bacterium]|nr:hypothetical protein [Bryobacterales bacterium]
MAAPIFPCIVLAQEPNESQTKLTPSEEQPNSRSITDDETESALQLAASQHPAVYCDFVLALLENRKAYVREQQFADELANVLVKQSATNELAPFYEIPGGIADTITALQTRATREVRCDRLNLTCRALRLQKLIAPAEAIKGFLLLQLPTQRTTPGEDPCPPHLFDYFAYYQLAADLLETLQSSTAHSRDDTEAFNLVSTLISSIATTRHLDSFLRTIEHSKADRQLLGHIAATLPSAVNRLSPSPHDFTIAGLTQQSFAALYKLCVSLREHDLPVSPILEAYRTLLTTSFQIDMCGFRGSSFPALYHDPVNTFNELFSGPTSRLNALDTR